MLLENCQSTDFAHCKSCVIASTFEAMYFTGFCRFCRFYSKFTVSSKKLPYPLTYVFIEYYQMRLLNTLSYNDIIILILLCLYVFLITLMLVNMLVFNVNKLVNSCNVFYISK